MKPISLKSRLVTLVLGVTTLIYLLSAFVLYESLEISATSSLRQMLDHQLELVTGLLEEEDDGRRIELELEALTSGDFVELFSGRYYVVLVPGQAPILSASLGGHLPDFMRHITPQGPEPKEHLLHGPQGDKLMILSQTIHFARRDIQVIVAESFAETKVWLHKIRTSLLLGIPLALLLMLALVWWVVSWGLRPLYGLIQGIHAFDPQHDAALPPRDLRTASELQQLAGAFDSLIARMHQVRQAEEHLLLEVSHQLKTPVTVILSTCDVMLQRERPATGYQNALEQIRATGRDMRTLLTRLLSAAHLASEGRRSLTLAPVTLKSVAAQAIRMMQPFADQKQIALEAITEPGPEVLADAGRLIEAVVILLENAIHYSPSDTTILVTTSGSAQQALLSVRDQGPGISEQDLPLVFTRFFRGAQAEGTEGSGLGLTIAQQIAQLHHGELSVISQPGRGACFTLSLPGRPVPLSEPVA